MSRAVIRRPLFGLTTLACLAMSDGSLQAAPTAVDEIDRLRAEAHAAFDGGEYSLALDLLERSLLRQAPDSTGRLWELSQIPRVLERLDRHCEARDAARRFIAAAPSGEPALEGRLADARTLEDRAEAACALTQPCAPGMPCPAACPDAPGCPTEVVEAPARPHRASLAVTSGVEGTARTLTGVEVAAGHRWPHLQLELSLWANVEGFLALAARPGLRIYFTTAIDGPFVRVAPQLLLLGDETGEGFESSLGLLAGAGWQWLVGESWGLLLEAGGSLWGQADGTVRFPIQTALGVHGAL